MARALSVTPTPFSNCCSHSAVVVVVVVVVSEFKTLFQRKKNQRVDPAIALCGPKSHAAVAVV